MIPKRAFWAGAGYAAGATTSIWAVRRAKRTLARYTPSAVMVRTRDRALDTGRRVRDAVIEGRDAARRREVELRAALEGGSAGAPIEAAPLRLVEASPSGGVVEVPALAAPAGANRGGRLRRVR